MVNLPENTILPEALSTHSLHYSLLRLDYTLPPQQVPLLRRFVNLFVGQDNDLFHNHKENKSFHYRYPLIQYKAIEGKAALVGLSDGGVTALQQLAAHAGFRERCAEWMGNGSIWQEEHSEDLHLLPKPTLQYRLHNYLALNEVNYRQWQQNPSIAARATLIERCLIGHILKFASAIRWQLPPRSLQVQLLDYRSHSMQVFDAKLMAFDVAFRTNIILPEGIGLGKAVSHGFGIVQT